MKWWLAKLARLQGDTGSGDIACIRTKTDNQSNGTPAAGLTATRVTWSSTAVPINQILKNQTIK